ncbi:MAG: GNAT family N-acetyltransferase [Pseudomonadota bacterium]
MMRVIELDANAAERMAALHAAAFPQEAAWSAAAFRVLLNQSAILARGIMRDGTLAAIGVIQFADGQAEILTLATAPEARRQGLAGMVLAAAERELRPEGLEGWLLDVAADNSGARAFYANLGFQTDGVRPKYYKRLEGPRVDAILMSKPVGGQIAR